MRGRWDLWLVSAGSVVSVSGNALALIALLLAIRPQGAIAVAGVMLAEALAVTVCAPLSGMLVDRLPNRRLMILAQLVQGCAAAGLATFLPTLGPVLGLLFLLGCGTSITQPAGAALIPAITGEAGSTRGYAWLSSSNALGQIIGSTAGSAVVAAFGPRTALFVDAATFFAEAVLLCLVRGERRPERTAKQPRALSAGLRHLTADRILLVTIGGLAVAVLAVVLLDVGEVFLVTDLLHGGALTLGMLSAGWMAGILIGSRLVSKISSQRGLAVVLTGAGAVMGLTVLVPALWPVTVLTVAVFVIGGITNAAQNVTNQALVRARTPEPLRGRVFSAKAAVIQGAFVLGIALGGVLIGLVGVRWTLAVAGLGSLVAGLAGLPFALGIRETAKGGTDSRSVPPEAAGELSPG